MTRRPLSTGPVSPYPLTKMVHTPISAAPLEPGSETPPALPQNYDHLAPNNPRSIFSLAPEALRRAMERVPLQYFEMSEDELAAQIKPNSTLNCLRFRLWDEYGRAAENQAPLHTRAICRGICTEHYLLRAVFRNPAMTAWLLTPPKSYEAAAEEALMFGLMRLREILTFPLYDERGRPNPAVGKLVQQVTRMLDDRLKGSPTQNINKRTLSITAKQVEDISKSTSMEELEKRLSKLRSEEEKFALQEERRPRLEEFKSGAIDVSVDEPLSNIPEPV